MKTSAIIPFFALPLLLVPVAAAQHETFTISPQASEVAFSLGGTGHTVHGTFHVLGGSVDFDRSTPRISGLVTVAAGSGNSGNTGRDEKMTAEVLDAPHFAEVTFAPLSYRGTLAARGDSSILVTGTFTLHGTPHQLTVPVQIHVDGDRLLAKAHFAVPYVQWGLKDPSVLILRVAKEVGIDLTFAGRLSP
jgi:polyisoprenoid-binding protein YceI